MRSEQWHIEWVEDMPGKMEPGNIYISVKHRLTEHLCACGCGSEVSLPLGKSEWHLLYDGDSISVWPSVGNWRLPCKSHYLIRENKTIWCSYWTEEKILKERYKDKTKTLAQIQRKNRQKSWLGLLLLKTGLKK